MRKRKISAIILIFIMISILTSACGRSAKNSVDPNRIKVDKEEQLAEEQVLRINWGLNPPNLDPQTAIDQVSFNILNAVYEGLVRLMPDGSVQKGSGLAKDWNISEDGLVYTFTLRDAQWSDGTEITAEDFEYAWKRALNPKNSSQYAYQLYVIKNAQSYNDPDDSTSISSDEVGVKALDKKTLRVELERPSPFFLRLTSFPTYLPAQKAVVEAFGEDFSTSLEGMAFSGPFVISEWTKEQRLVLERNEYYWDVENVKLERIEGDMIREVNTEVNLFENGQLDAIIVTTDYLDRYRNKPGFGSIAIATTWYLQFNTEDKFFSNEKIRRALSMAIDREDFVDNMLANGSITAYGLVPSGILGKNGGDFRHQNGELFYDVGRGIDAVNEANRLLQEGLQEIGETKESLEAHVTYLTDDGNVARRFAQAFQGMWKRTLGLEIPIEALPLSIRLDRYDRKDYSLSLAGWSGDYNDPMTFLNLFITHGYQNDTYWSNGEYDNLIRSANLVEENERMEAMLQAEQILMKEMPIAPIYFRAKNYVERPYIKGWARFPIGVENEFKWTYILEH